MSSTENLELRTGCKRHTGVLEGAPSSEAALWAAHGNKDAERVPAMRYFTALLAVEKVHKWQHGRLR